MLGVTGIYIEFIWPGRVIPGLLGGAGLVCGSYFLGRHSPTAIGIGFIVIAAALFIAESLWDTRFLAGSLAAACLAAGACRLFDKKPGIPPASALPISIAFGVLTIFLSYAAKRARRNKWSDIKHPRSSGNFSGR